jgi:hypothetical protein
VIRAKIRNASTGMPDGVNLIGASLPFAGLLVSNSALTGGSVVLVAQI